MFKFFKAKKNNNKEDSKENKMFKVTYTEFTSKGVGVQQTDIVDYYMLK